MRYTRRSVSWSRRGTRPPSSPRPSRPCAASPASRAVVVVDDGSIDGTGKAARGVGADVVRHVRSRGKAAALETGCGPARRVEAQVTGRPPAGLAAAVRGRRPAGQRGQPRRPRRPRRGRHGRHDHRGAAAAGTARAAATGSSSGSRPAGIVDATGWTPTQPLSGMRCLTREAFEAARPLAHGWGVETALTIDLLRAGYRVAEVPCELHHRVTGADWRGQLHRARQYRDVARGLATRRFAGAAPLRVLRRLTPTGAPREHP